MCTRNAWGSTMKGTQLQLGGKEGDIGFWGSIGTGGIQKNVGGGGDLVDGEKGTRRWTFGGNRKGQEGLDLQQGGGSPKGGRQFKANKEKKNWWQRNQAYQRRFEVDERKQGGRDGWAGASGERSKSSEHIKKEMQN